MMPEMIFTATEAIGFSYGVTWNTVRRNIFQLEARRGRATLKRRSRAFAMSRIVLRFLKDFILFAEKEEELQKFILRQHQTTAVDKVVDARARPETHPRTGLAHARQRQDLHDDQSGRTALQSERRPRSRPSCLMIDRNELEDQMLKNLASVGLSNVAHADSHCRAERVC